MIEHEASLAIQEQLYGVTLGDAVSNIAETLSISRAAIARVLGVSAPMLSQLASGQRTKIGNPQVVQRLHALIQLVDEVEQGLAHDQLPHRLEQIAADNTGTLTQNRNKVAPGGAEAVSKVLRAVASGRELAAAAEALKAAHPGLAEVLGVYGTGTPAQAQAHFDSLASLWEGAPSRQ